jgi:hypothetical protein
MTDFSATESVTTEKPLDDPLLNPPHTENDMSRQYDSMDTVVAPNVQKLSNNPGVSHKPRNSINLGAGPSGVSNGATVDNSKTVSNQQNIRSTT